LIAGDVGQSPSIDSVPAAIGRPFTLCVEAYRM